jgi:hypothetical protein
VALLKQRSASLAALVDLDLIPDDKAKDEDDRDETRNEKPASGHAGSLTLF